MEREQYAVMAQREDTHWWYVGMRRAALALLASALDRPAVDVLDAGCGTGGTTIHLGRFGRVVGVDLAWEALLPAAARGLRGRLVLGSVERLPFSTASFDVVTSFEVIYHLGVGDDRRAFAELRRVLRPRGLLLLRLPAHDWLRGEHDRLVHTRHRYGRAEVRDRLAEAGLRLEWLGWANSLLFPPAAAKRLMERALAAGRSPAAADQPPAAAEPDLWQPPGPVNAALAAIVALEAAAFRRRVSPPFGLSVIALARAE